MDYFLGPSDGMRDLVAQTSRILQSGVPILIEGETGAGKERLAAHLHHKRGSGGRMIRFLCDGAPLSADVGPGRELTAGFDQNPRDTFLLKRVHNLPGLVQENLLRSLDATGGTVPCLISTTSVPLERLAQEGRFLPELLYRLSAYRVSLPPLRERSGEIPRLFEEMLEEMAAQAGVAAPPVDARMTEALKRHVWPGNLRELQNAARSYLIAPGPAGFAGLAGLERERLEREGLERELEQRRPATARHAATGPLKEQVRQASRRVEGEIILRTLEQHHWNRRLTAEALRISYRSLMYKMKNCNLRGDHGMRPSRVAQ